MALFTEENVRANVRVKDGRRVFYLGNGDRLSPAARQWLGQEQIEILPAAQAKPAEFRTLFGATLTEKPEHMTHLYGNVLVFKDHPRIAFRGMIDTLEAEILCCTRTAAKERREPLCRDLREILQFVRELIPCDVMEKPVGRWSLCGMSESELRERSHYPQKYYGQPHFMPSDQDCDSLLALNRVRTCVRETELAAYRAFRTAEGAPTREDIILALNRLSSLIWILMIRLKAEESKNG